MSFPKSGQGDYNKFKTRILEEHPRADKGAQYVYHDVENIVLCHINQDISTETEFVEYSHKFHPIATWLVKNKKISEHEHDKLFWQGLPRHVQREITMQLRLDNPKGFDRSMHPNFEKVIHAGCKALGNNRFDAVFNDLVSLRIQATRNASTPTASNIRSTPLHGYDNTNRYHQVDDARQEVHTKTVRFDANSADKPSSNEIEDLTRRMYNMNINEAAYAGCYMRLVYLNPASAQYIAAPAKYCTSSPAPIQQSYTTINSPATLPVSSSSCYMCGGPHILGNCPVVDDYISAGHIVRKDGFLVYPDGSRLHRHYGTGLFRTSIDERYGNSLPVQPSAPTSTSPPEFRRDPPPHLVSTAYGTVEPDSASFIIQCLPLVDNDSMR